jgi:hypothetical protein
MTAALGVLAIALLCLTASLATRTQSFSLGVTPSSPVAELRAHETLCQGPIDVVDHFERVTLTLGTFRRPGPPLDVRVRDAATRKVLATGHLAAGYADNKEQRVGIGRVGRGGRIAVCVTNEGRHRVATYGSADAAHVPSSAAVDGKPKGVDATMRFLYDEPRSLLSLAPQMVERATLFAPSWLSPGMLWALFGLVVFAVPGLLGYALSRISESAAEDGPAPGPAAAAELQAGAPVEP